MKWTSLVHLSRQNLSPHRSFVAPKVMLKHNLRAVEQGFAARKVFWRGENEMD